MLNQQRERAIENLQRNLNYEFRQMILLKQALTHRSYGSQNYERLEFIGDSILDYVIAKMLYEAFPQLPEGRLSPLRAQLVREATLADMARSLNLGAALFLGAGELKSGGNDRASILADTLEAVFAAVSLDSDFAAAEKLIRRLFQNKINSLNINQTAKDAKTQLQEYLQARKLALPKYKIEQQTGEGSDTLFDVSCDLGELGKITYARASARRVAEQACAAEALIWLQEKFGQSKK